MLFASPVLVDHGGLESAMMKQQAIMMMYMMMPMRMCRMSMLRCAFR